LVVGDPLCGLVKGAGWGGVLHISRRRGGKEGKVHQHSGG